mgnify:CR=1 FL=1
MADRQLKKIKTIDSHTGGEVTRVIVEGGPDLGESDLASRQKIFQAQYDHIRTTVVNEPRGSDVVVGALLLEPADPRCSAGVIYFNNVGYLGMCGHGTIGLVKTLAHMKRVEPGDLLIQTPVGVVQAFLHPTGEVTVVNIPSYLYLKDVELEVPGFKTMTGDVAWGGNWFFLVEDHGLALTMENIDRLTDCAVKIRTLLEKKGIRGKDDQPVDHIELFGPPSTDRADSRNFVLCPGNAYDRSPCGTGTSAKMACLYEKGLLPLGQPWRQESIIGSIFEGCLKKMDGKLYPSIKGTAHITGESTLIIDPLDPFCSGIDKRMGARRASNE